jgi:DNA modification methylase
MEAMVEYANENGDPDGKPYFAPEGENPITAEEWERYRAKFDCPAGVTNVWEHPQVNGSERLEDEDGTLHINQKPIKLMSRVIKASTEQEDVIWEPFGGLCTATVAAKQLNREAYAAEIVDKFYKAATERIKEIKIDDIEKQESQSGLEDWE